MDISKQALQLKKALNESRYTIAITGAGISFSAGSMNFDHENVAELLPLASEDTLRNEPDKYYKLLDHAFLHSMFANEPSFAHKALRSLEINGLLNDIMS
ncbi:MAG: hypothetical protein LUG61_02405 [Lachnospiraceae bacterium]|nr:hypothetical protein [Lachnospiraceae bacterium]